MLDRPKKDISAGQLAVLVGLDNVLIGQSDQTIQSVNTADSGSLASMNKVKVLGDVPLRTISQPEDIGNLALFLASDESRTITGQSINCDAGSIMIG